MSDLPYAKKSLGQHWLSDSSVLGSICDAAHVAAGDVVLEIGPGAGTLTDELIDRGAEVVALEFDQDLVKTLTIKYANTPSTSVVVQSGDIRTYDFRNMPPGYKIVANIPYYLTSELIRLISETSNPPETAVLLIQKEVAERVAAQPGDMSLLSITAQYYWEAHLGLEVPARFFTPPPKVDSQVLILNRRPRPLFPDTDEKRFFRLVKAGFAARRKTLLNSLSGGLRTDKEQIKTILDESYIEPTIRPQNLSLEQWYLLYKAAASQNLV